jgi:hypothetical protein
VKVIIAGSRTIKDYLLVKSAVIESGFIISKVIEGGAKGVDRLGRLWAVRNGRPFITYNADWELYGRRSAGSIRNNKMAKVGNALIAVWDGQSTGTKNMIELAIANGLRVFVKIPDQEFIRIKQQRTFISKKSSVVGYSFGYSGN